MHPPASGAAHNLRRADGRVTEGQPCATVTPRDNPWACQSDAPAKSQAGGFPPKGKQVASRQKAPQAGRSKRSDDPSSMARCLLEGGVGVGVRGVLPARLIWCAHDVHAIDLRKRQHDSLAHLLRHFDCTLRSIALHPTRGGDLGLEVAVGAVIVAASTSRFELSQLLRVLFELHLRAPPRQIASPMLRRLGGQLVAIKDEEQLHAILDHCERAPRAISSAASAGFVGGSARDAGDSTRVQSAWEAVRASWAEMRGPQATAHCRVIALAERHQCLLDASYRFGS